MKTSFLLGATLLGVALWSPLVLAQSTAAVVASLEPTAPAEFTSMMSPGAVTVKIGQLPLMANDSLVRFHVWRLDRRSLATSSQADAPSIMCIDFFERVAEDAGTTEKWKLAASAPYLSRSSQGGPETTYKSHWLEATTRQGLVLIAETPRQTGATYTLITLPRGLESQPFSSINRPFVQEFHASYSGGTIHISFSRDARGRMTVEEKKIPPVDAPAEHNTYAWDGGKWARVASRTKKQR